MGGLIYGNVLVRYILFFKKKAIDQLSNGGVCAIVSSMCASSCQRSKTSGEHTVFVTRSCVFIPFLHDRGVVCSLNCDEENTIMKKVIKVMRNRHDVITK